MEIMYLLIPLSLILVLVIGVFLWWSTNNNQFDDLEAEGRRIFEDENQSGPPDKAP